MHKHDQEELMYVLTWKTDVVKTGFSAIMKDYLRCVWLL